MGVVDGNNLDIPMTEVHLFFHDLDPIIKGKGLGMDQSTQMDAMMSALFRR